MIGALQRLWQRAVGRKPEGFTRFDGYLQTGSVVTVRPAPSDREWMDQTAERFAYRCLPLTIANAHGWELLLSNGFSAAWNGGTGLDAITIETDPDGPAPAISHFGHGILTMHVPCLFRTSRGVDLIVQGPINRPKDGIAALTGIIETDWAPYTFTMNWRFTRPGATVRFEAGEPFCHLFPIRRGELEVLTPRLQLMTDDAALDQQHGTWRAARFKFNADLDVPDSAARKQRWQKFYHRGQRPDGDAGTDDHRTKVRVKPFIWE